MEDAHWDLIDDVEERLQGREAKIAALDALAASAPHGSTAWIDFTVTASEHRLMDGDIQRAIEVLQSIRDSVPRYPTSVDATLHCAYLHAQDDLRVAELDRALRARSREEHLGDTYCFVADSYEEANRRKEALRWYTMANRDVDPTDLDRLDYFAVVGRWRLRRDLGLPEDAYDVSAQILRAEQLDQLREDGLID